MLGPQDVSTSIHPIPSQATAFVISAAQHLRLFSLTTGALLSIVPHLAALSGTVWSTSEFLFALDHRRRLWRIEYLTEAGS